MDRVLICKTCAGGERFADALLAAGVQVEAVACMNQCDRPIALALRAEGKDVYLFAGVEPGDVADAVALAQLYAQSDGTITDARASGRLRDRLVGRVPG